MTRAPYSPVRDWERRVAHRGARSGRDPGFRVLLASAVVTLVLAAALAALSTVTP